MPPVQPFPFNMPQPPQMPTESVTVAAQAPDDMDDLRERLVQAITDRIHGPEPTPPMYQPAQPSPLQAFAQARNPQLAGAIEQGIQAPGQARFQQQQAAFEQAMQGRREALTAGTSMLNAETRRAGVGGRPALGTIEVEQPDGTKRRTLVNIIRDPDGTARIQEIGPAPWAPAVVQGTVGGRETTSLVSKDTGRVRDTGIQPRPTEGTVQNISDITNVLRNIDTIRNNPLVAAGEGKEFSKRLGQETVRSVPIVGPQLSSKINPDVEGFEADIDNVRARVQLILTGKVVNQTEIKRLLGLIPAGSTATNPEFFRQRLQRFTDEFQAVLRRQARLRPDLFTPEELMSLGVTATHAQPAAGTPSDDVEEYIRQRQQAMGPK